MDLPSKAEAAVRDTIGVTPDDRAEIRRVGDVILKGVQPKHHALGSAASCRNEKVAEHRSPRDDLRLRPTLRANLDLMHRPAVDLAENAHVHEETRAILARSGAREASRRFRSSGRVC